MKIIFLGTNGWYTTPTGNTPCILIDSRDHYVILDAGNGIYKLDKYIKEDKPISLFISHFHLDHISGLHTFLPKFSFSQNVNIYVGKDRKKDFDIITNPPFTTGYEPNPTNIINTPMKINVHELADGKNNIDFPVSVFEQFHGYRDHGFRIKLENKIIAYSGDCGISQNSYKLAQNADLLIHECSWIKAPKEDKWGHVDSIQAAKLAKDANVKLLALNHFDASKFDTLEKRKDAERKAQEIFPNTIAAYDDLEIEI
jgi:ribonuclease Z